MAGHRKLNDEEQDLQRARVVRQLLQDYAILKCVRWPHEQALSGPEYKDVKEYVQQIY